MSPQIYDRINRTNTQAELRAVLKGIDVIDLDGDEELHCVQTPQVDCSLDSSMRDLVRES